jgi:hypothetical protein
MSDWRDDLPPIPSDEIRRDVIREGSRRRERRRQRQRAVLLSGLGVAAVAALVVAGAAIGRDDEDSDSGAAATAAPAEGTVSITTTPAAEAPAGTEAPEGTEEASSETTAATEDAAGGTDPGGDTTVSAPQSSEVVVIPSEIWEQPASRPACGPTTIEVTFQPQSRTLQAPIVHWRISRIAGESPMVIVGRVARATIGPFVTNTLEVSSTRPVVLYVTDSDAAGVLQRFRAPMVVLHDCPP